MGICGHFRTFGKYSDFLTVFVVPAAPEIVSESISQQKQQNQSTMDAGEPKPSRRNDLSPPHFHWIFPSGMGNTFPNDSWNLGGSTHRFRFSIARMVLCEIVSSNKNIDFQCFADFAATNQRRDLWESTPCFDGTDEEFISKFEPKIDGP